MNFTKEKLTSGSVLLAAVVGSNFLNFLFNAILGRLLSFSDFGLITLIVTFYYLTGIVTNALSATLNFHTSGLHASNNHDHADHCFRFFLKKSVLYATVVTLLWLAISPLVQTFFNVPTIWPLLAFAPVMLLSVVAYATTGFLQGSFRFKAAAAVIISEPIFKLVVGLIVAMIGLGTVAYISVPASLLAAAVISVAAMWTVRANPATAALPATFPRTFFITSLVTSLSSTLFFSLDILLVKHFFSPELAGQYAILSLIGKMMFFFSTIFNIFTLPLVVRAETREERNKLFLSLVGVTFVLAFLGWGALGVFGKWLVPLLLGSKALVIVPLLPLYTLAIGLYSVASVTISFHIAQKDYQLSSFALGASLLFATCILLNHANLEMLVADILTTAVVLVLALVGWVVFSNKRNFAYA